MIKVTSQNLKKLEIDKLDCSQDGQTAIDYCESRGGVAYLHELPVCTAHKIWCYIKATQDPTSPYIDAGYSINDILLHASDYDSWKEFLAAYNDKENHNYFTCKDYIKAYMLLEKVKHKTSIESTVTIIMKYIPEDVINDFFENLSH